VRIQKCEKGQIRVLEAFFAALLVFSSLFLVPSITMPKSENLSELYSVGMNVLLQLDSDGSLSNFIKSENWSDLRICLQEMLPSGVWFNLTVLNTQGARLNNVSISNGYVVSEKKVSVEYLCVSSVSTYEIYIVRLQLAKAGLNE